MSVRQILDLSTIHLSPAARAWLSETATLNHAANYHGTGSGAAMSTLGATLNGWFMHAPVLPENGGMDHGMPEDLYPIIRHAHDKRCDFICFDADADILLELPMFDAEVAQATPVPAAKPMAFQYFEVRPCIETYGRLSDQDDPGSVDSFRSEDDYAAELSKVVTMGERYKTYWTIYGIDSEGLGFAIGDFNTKAAAHEIMNAILAPMAEARNKLDAGDRNNVGVDVLCQRIDEASCILEDFINQCSNSERI